VPGGADVPVVVRRAENGSVHVWVGKEPDAELERALPVAAGTLVLHGHGVGGGLGVPAARLVALARREHGVTQVVLLAC
jgi:hypothetical protein